MSTPSPKQSGRGPLELIFKGVLVILASYHVITGVVAVFFPEFSRPFYDALYHAKPYYWDQYRLILKPWGSYALFTGALLWFAWWDPRRYRPVIWATTGLLAIRVAYRLWFMDEALQVFGIDHARNYLNVGLLLTWIAVLTTWTVNDWRETRRRTPAPRRAKAEAEVPAA